MNCKIFALVARMLTAKYFLWWREGELQNVFSGGEKVNCKMFALVANR